MKKKSDAIEMIKEAFDFFFQNAKFGHILDIHYLPDNECFQNFINSISDAIMS